MTSVRPIVPLLLAALLLAPAASAAWPVRVTVHPAPYHLGDVLETRWNNSFVQEGRTQRYSGSVVTAFQGLGTALDKYGIERPTVDVRSDARVDGEPFGSQICHLLQGGNRTVRTEVLWGSNGYSASWRSGGDTYLGGLVSTQSTLKASPKAYFWGSCDLHLPARSSITEGDRVPAREIFSTWTGMEEPGLSDPAVATTFHGRDAMRLAWRLEDLWPGHGTTGTLSVVLADGLPGVVAGGNHGVTEDGQPFRYEHELVGYSAGEGPEAPLLQGATLPERDPAARFVPTRPLAAGDEALRLPYPYAEAFADAKTLVPRFAAFLDAHPDAVLTNAYYDRYCRAGPGLPPVAGSPVAQTDGCWWITVGEANAARQVFVARRAVPQPPGAGPLRTPLQAYAQDLGDPGDDGLPTRAALPADGIDSSTLARVAQREGVRTDAVETFWVGTWAAGNGKASRYYAVGDVSTNSVETQPGTREGLTVNVDAQSGGATNVYVIGKTTESSGLLAPPEGSLEEERLAALSALAGPGVGVGLGVGAATGLALLVVAVKFLLVPLFTRLVRARLLDNPVRARLYERIRTEPGIRQAELVDYLGVGEGATRHHLAQLVKHRYAVETRDGASAAYFAAGEVPPDVARRATVLRSASTKRVYDLYAEAPGLTLREAAARLGMSAPSVHRQKRKLEKAGLLPSASAVSPSP